MYRPTLISGQRRVRRESASEQGLRRSGLKNPKPASLARGAGACATAGSPPLGLRSESQP
eukprot:1179035-Prorocentrum_minimum.AAC.2